MMSKANFVKGDWIEFSDKPGKKRKKEAKSTEKSTGEIYGKIHDKNFTNLYFLLTRDAQGVRVPTPTKDLVKISGKVRTKVPSKQKKLRI